MSLLKKEKEEVQKVSFFFFNVLCNNLIFALKEKQDLTEKLKLQEKELNDALSQRKLAMTEYTEVTDR